MKEDNNGGEGATWEARTAKGISGGLAGFLSTFLGHPLEIIKTRLQVRKDLLRVATFPTWSMTKELAQLDRPLSQFYRGITANTLASGVTWAVFWPLKDIIEGAILAGKPNPSSSGKPQLSKLDTFLATALTSFAIQIVSNPIWVVKTRMLAKPRGHALAYDSTLAAFTKIYRVEGFKTFYSGFCISFGGIFQGGVQFVFYDHVKQAILLQQRQSHNIAEGSRADRLSVVDTSILSCVAKSVAITCTYPYQVIRSRMQMPDAERSYGKGIAGVARGLYRENKLRAFYKGLGPAIARNLPATCVTFLVYEKLSPQLTELLSGVKKGGVRQEP